MLDISGLGVTPGNFETEVDITDLGSDTLVEIGEESILLVGVNGVGANTITQQDFLLESASFASGATGELKLDASSQFAGQVSGLAGQDLLDLADIAFGPNNTGGTLTVSDGTHMADIALLGQYIAGSFVMPADGFGGTLFHDPPPATLTQTLTQPQHA